MRPARCSILEPRAVTVSDLRASSRIVGENMLTIAKYCSLIVLVLSLVALGYALNDIAGGPGEALNHWWSSLPLVLATTAAATWIGAVLFQRRHHPERDRAVV